MKWKKVAKYLFPKLEPYEKKPFIAYPLFLLILVPLIVPNQTESELYDRIVLLAFATTIITTIISFWLILKGRKAPKITVLIKKGKTKVRTEFKNKKSKFQLESTDRNVIISKIEEKTGLTRKQIEENMELETDDDSGTGAGKIFSVLYALVAAIAITNALDFFMDPQTAFTLPFDLGGDVKNFEMTDSLFEIGYLIISQEFILLLSFFVIGTFFYHCGLAFFSDQASKMLEKGMSLPEIVLSGIILFTEGIFLYFAAGSIGSVLQFSLWIFFLMIVDIAWVLLNSFHLKKDYAQWIHFDFIMLIFLLTILLSYGTAQLEPSYHHYVIVFLVLLCRTILDYKLSWEFFAKFDILSEK